LKTEVPKDTRIKLVIGGMESLVRAAFKRFKEGIKRRLLIESGTSMLDRELMRSVAAQMMNSSSVDVDGTTLRVKRTGSGRLRTVRFLMNGNEYQAIEQNPEKPSRWGELTRQGRQVVQFRDLASQRYVAVAVDGEVKEFGRMRSTG
jgi:YD repeat-containing protein